MENSLLKIVNTLLATIGVDEIGALEPNLNLRDDLEIDSITYAELVVRIEDELGVDINEDGRLETIGEILSKVLSKSDA